MNVVIIGNGKVGSSLSAFLAKENHDVTVVDTRATALERSKNSQDILCIEGNGATAEVQLEANVKKAGLLIATTPYDELNMLCCLIAKKLGAKKTISRVRNPEYFKQTELIRDDLGLSMIINPERSTADEMFRVLLFPSAAKLEVFGKGRVELVEHTLSENSKIIDMSLAEIYKQIKVKILICAVVRNGEIFIPDGGFVLRAGDRISISASHKDIEKFFRIAGLLKDKIKTVMIVGGGRICYYLAQSLLSIGMRVKIIENDYERCEQLAELLPKATVIHGDGTDQELLMEEGIADADSFVALTGIDEENMIMSLYAKNNTDAKVITKVNRESYIDLASQIGLDTVMSPKLITTSNILSYVRSLANAQGSNIESLYHIVGNKAEAAEFRISERIPGLVGVPLRELEIKKGMLVCAIIRKREVIVPGGNDSMELGDLVVVVSKEERLSEITDILA